jgi:hypothetical protein
MPTAISPIDPLVGQAFARWLGRSAQDEARAWTTRQTEMLEA